MRQTKYWTRIKRRKRPRQKRKSRRQERRWLPERINPAFLTN